MNSMKKFNQLIIMSDVKLFGKNRTKPETLVQKFYCEINA